MAGTCVRPRRRSRRRTGYTHPAARVTLLDVLDESDIARVYLWLGGKRIVDFLLMIIELFR